jgi:cyclohexanone monooxygenase
MEYSYQFSDALQQDWVWTERYAAQPEILRYANHVADRFDLRSGIDFKTRVRSARFDEATKLWTVLSDDGRTWTARYCIMATGCLSSANNPHFEGMESFTGKIHHTGRWPHDGVDFTGLRVGVIGTGSSAIQAIPIIARAAGRLTVFQRTPNYVVPAHNQPLDPGEQARIKSNYAELRARARLTRNGISWPVNQVKALEVGAEDREREYEMRWRRGGLSFTGAFMDTLLDAQSNAQAADFIRRKIRSIVHDPATAELLCPKTIVGCKRLCVDSGYFETFNRPNVTLVDVSSSPIERMTPRGVRVAGREHDLEAIVLATGFDAMTGSLNKIDIRGRGDGTLAEAWSAGPRTYLGLASAGFPNLFLITGPGSPSVLTNMLPSIEQHVEWIAECMAEARRRGVSTVEAEIDAQDEWVGTVNGIAAQTLFPGCNSWYLGANIPGKPRVFMPYIGFPSYLEKCADVVANGYRGFRMT